MPTPTFQVPSQTQGFQTMSVILNFDEDVTGLDVLDFSVTDTNVQINRVDGSGFHYSIFFDLPAAMMGTFTITLRAGAVTSVADPSQTNTAVTSGSVSYDRTQLPGTFTPPTNTETNRITATNIDVTLAFEEPVNGVDITDFTVSRSDVQIVSVTGDDGDSSYTINIDLPANAFQRDFTISLRSNRASSVATPVRRNPFLRSDTIFFHTFPLTGTLSVVPTTTETPIIGTPITAVLEFNQQVNGVDITDFSLDNSNVQITTVDGDDGDTTFGINMDMPNNTTGTFVLTLNAGRVNSVFSPNLTNSALTTDTVHFDTRDVTIPIFDGSVSRVDERTLIFSTRGDAIAFASVGGNFYFATSNFLCQVDLTNNDYSFVSQQRFGIGVRCIDLATIGNNLYMLGISGDAENLYSIDTSTGVASRIGTATNFGVGETRATGLAAIGNTLYMVGRTHDELYQVSTSTGEATRVGTAVAFGVNEFLPDKLVNINDTLYMLGDSNDALYTVNTSTGVASRVGTRNEDFTIAYGYHNTTLYRSTSEEIHTVDITNFRDIAYLFNTSWNFRIRDVKSLAYDPPYLYTEINDRPYRINPSTGIMSIRDDSVFLGVSAMTTLAGQIYVLDNRNNLSRYDPSTNQEISLNIRFLFPNDFPARFTGIAFIGTNAYLMSGGTLYVATLGNPQATRIGSSSVRIIELQSIGNRLYGIDSTTNSLQSIDTTTGVATRIGNVSAFDVSGSPSGRGLSYANGNLYYIPMSNSTVELNLYTFDTLTLTTTIVVPLSSQDDPITSRTTSVSVIFSTHVTGIDVTDFSVTNTMVQLSRIVGSDDGSTYTVSFDLPANTVGNFTVTSRSGAGVAANTTVQTPAATSDIIYFDTTGSVPPTVVITSPDTVAFDSSFSGTLTFSAPVNGLTVSDFLTGSGQATVGAISGSGRNYTYTATAPSSGTLAIVTLTANSVRLVSDNLTTGPRVNASSSDITLISNVLDVASWTTPMEVVTSETVSATATFTFNLDSTSVATSDFTITDPNTTVTNVTVAGDTATLAMTIRDRVAGSFAIQVNQNAISSSETGILDGPPMNRTSPMIQYDTRNAIEVVGWAVPMETIRSEMVTASVTFNHNVDVSSISIRDFTASDSNVTITGVTASAATITISMTIADTSTGDFTLTVLQDSIDSSDTGVIDGPAQDTTSPTMTYDTRGVAPSISLIPPISLIVGGSESITLDEFIEGEVADDGVSISGNPAWITLGAGMGINRTISIAPPTGTSATSPFSEFTFRVTAMGPDGSDSRDVTVYLYPAAVAEETPPPVIEPIPITVLAPGETDTIALDQYISGMVNDDGVTLSSGESWITIGMGTGVNKTISIAPPTSITTSTQYEVFLFAAGPGGSVDQTLSVYVDVPYTPPTPLTPPPEIDVIPVQVLAPGETTTIALDTYVSGDVNDDGITISGEPSWVTISTLDLNDPNARGVNRTITIAPPSTITASEQFAYTLSVVGSGGTTTQVLTVYVDVPYTPPTPPVDVPTISVIPVQVLPPSATRNISVDTYVSGDVNNDGITISGQPSWVTISTLDLNDPNARGVNRTITIAPPGTITASEQFFFTLSAAGSGGTSTQQVTVYVDVPTVVTDMAPNIAVIPVQVLAPGETTTISVDDYVSGDVNNDGITISGEPSWVTISALDLNDPNARGVNRTITIAPPTSITASDQFFFMLNATGSGGSSAQQVTIYVDVPYTPPTPPTPAPEIAVIPVQVLAPGGTRDLSVDTYVSGDVNADGITISGEPSWITISTLDLNDPNARGVNRTITIAPPPTITASEQFFFTLSAEGSGGTTTQQVTVYVDVPTTPTAGAPNISPIPVQVLAPAATGTISVDTYVSGDVNNDGITISGNESWITISTLDLNDPNARGVNRTISIAPPNTITDSTQYFFTLSAEGPGGTTTQQVSVYVDVPTTTPTPATEPPVISPIPVQVLIPGGTRDLSLDTYVSGMVNDDGIAISGEPTWVTLGSGMGVNRTITIAPLSTITTSEQFFFTLTATGPGGTASQQVTVYVDAPYMPPVPTASVFQISWNVPDGSVDTTAGGDLAFVATITPAISNTEAQLRSTTDRILQIDGIALDVDDTTNVDFDIMQNGTPATSTTLTITITAPTGYNGVAVIGVDDSKLTAVTP